MIFGALLLEFLPIYAQDPPLLPFELSKQSPTVIFGVMLILIMFVLPGGVASLIRAPDRADRAKPQPPEAGEAAVASQSAER